MKKRWTMIPADETTVQNLHSQLKIHPVFCRLLVQRGIHTFEEARQFFRPELSHLHNPFLMLNMDNAIERIIKAIKEEERILLYGDYDVDGVTSVSLMYDFLSTYHSKLDYYIPDRYKEGYGISMQGVDYAKQNGVTLIIAMDCGIKAVEQVAKAKELGIDFIICDHHLPDESLPDAVAILDPKQKNCKYPYKELSGCGVSFKLAQAFCQKKGFADVVWEGLLDFLVISISADIVPITGENRVLAYFGLKQLNQTKRQGIKALIHESRRTKSLTISDIVFGLAPIINAAGRLSDAKQAVRLLLSSQKFIAYENAHFLKTKNDLRKEYDLMIAGEAKKMFREFPDWETRKSIVLYQPHWHKGIVGIAASRMVDTFHKPAIILTESNGKIVGSARSVSGFNVYDAIKSCAHLLVNFGGHNHAAGLTLLEEDLEEFTAEFEKIVQHTIQKKSLEPELPISAALDFKDIDKQFFEILRQFAPFGPSNRNPLFGSKNVSDIGFSKLLTGNHLRLAVKQDGEKTFYGIAFQRGDDLEKVKSEKPFHIVYKLEENHWKGDSTLQLNVKDMKF